MELFFKLFYSSESYANFKQNELRSCIICACRILRRFDLAFMSTWGKVAMEKMPIMNTFGPVLINSRCISYMLADHS